MKKKSQLSTCSHLTLTSLIFILIGSIILNSLSCQNVPTNTHIDNEFIKSNEYLKNPSQWDKLCISENLEVACWLTGKYDHTMVDKHRIPILQGPSSSTQAQFVLTVSKSENILVTRLYDREHKKVIAPFKVYDAQRDYSGFKNIHLLFNNLVPETEYELVVGDIEGRVIDERKLLTWPTYMPSLDFAVASCADDLYVKKGGREMWEDLTSWHPQFLLLIGDSVYADLRDGKVITPLTPKDMWGRYIDGRIGLPIYKMYFLIPTFAVWDDHDYGANDGDKDFALREESYKIFKDFFPHERIEGVYENGPGVSSAFVVANQRFILADDRYFRSHDQIPPLSKSKRIEPVLKEKQGVDSLDASVMKDLMENEYETHFGSEGEKWIFKNLRQKPLPTWLISGDQFFGAYHPFESYEGNHPNSFIKFLVGLKKSPSSVVFISGDRHLSELMRIESPILGYETYEVTSSGIHAKLHPGAWDENKNPRFMQGASGVFNYTMIHSEVALNELHFQVTSYKAKREVIYKEALKIPASRFSLKTSKGTKATPSKFLRSDGKDDF